MKKLAKFVFAELNVLRTLFRNLISYSEGVI